VTTNDLQAALQDENPRVRQNALRVAEGLLSRGDDLADPFAREIVERASDPDRGVRYQLTLALGEWKSQRASEALARLAAGPDAGHTYFRAALLSCGAQHPGAIQQLEPDATRPVFASATETELNRLRVDPAATASARAVLASKFDLQRLAAGSADRGSEVFARACALCHKAGNLGFDVGPTLAPLRDKPADYWVKNILEPNAAIEPRFIACIVELANGGTIAGLIKSETATSVTLVQPGGISGTLLRPEIKRITPAKSSLMPEDFEKSVSPAELADLVAFLRSEANK
jgi:putative heme-binding domain-containing protein